MKDALEIGLSITKAPFVCSTVEFGRGGVEDRGSGGRSRALRVLWWHDKWWLIHLTRFGIFITQETDTTRKTNKKKRAKTPSPTEWMIFFIFSTLLWIIITIIMLLRKFFWSILWLAPLHCWGWSLAIDRVSKGNANRTGLIVALWIEESQVL